MDITTILDTFAHATDIPRDALAAADADRQATLPVFLSEIERFLAADASTRAEPSPVFFIVHLLASWREKSAYHPLARLMRCSTKDVDHVLRDAVTDSCQRIMASVFDGDAQPLYDIVLDPAADETIRSRMCDALAILVIRGELPLDEVRGFLRQAHPALQLQPRNFVWEGWQHAVAVLGLKDLAPLVAQAFESGHISRGWLDPKHFREDLEWALAHPGELPPRDGGTQFGDPIEELSAYLEFAPEPATAAPPRLPAATQNARSGYVVQKPAVNPFKGVGRNDPCPCGSGKKFKACCLPR